MADRSVSLLVVKACACLHAEAGRAGSVAWADITIGKMSYSLDDSDLTFANIKRSGSLSATLYSRGRLNTTHIFRSGAGEIQNRLYVRVAKIGPRPLEECGHFGVQGGQ
jgi:hypothetical protein